MSFFHQKQSSPHVQWQGSNILIKTDEEYQNLLKNPEVTLPQMITMIASILDSLDSSDPIYYFNRSILACSRLILDGESDEEIILPYLKQINYQWDSPIPEFALNNYIFNNLYSNLYQLQDYTKDILFSLLPKKAKYNKQNIDKLVSKPLNNRSKEKNKTSFQYNETDLILLIAEKGFSKYILEYRYPQKLIILLNKKTYFVEDHTDLLHDFLLKVNQRSNYPINNTEINQWIYSALGNT